jgi:hypothetical protein
MNPLTPISQGRPFPFVLEARGAGGHSPRAELGMAASSLSCLHLPRGIKTLQCDTKGFLESREAGAPAWRRALLQEQRARASRSAAGRAGPPCRPRPAAQTKKAAAARERGPRPARACRNQAGHSGGAGGRPPPVRAAPARTGLQGLLDQQRRNTQGV